MKRPSTYSEQALQLSSRPAVPNIARLALTLKGKCLIAQKRYDLAAQTLSHAIDTIEHIRDRAAGQEQERALFFEGKTEPYQLMTESLILQEKDHQAFLFAERAKGRILLDVMLAGKASVNGVITPEERERDQKLNWAVDYER